MFGSIKLYIALAVVAAFLGLGAYAYTVKLERDVAVTQKALVEKELTKAVNVNKQNNETISRLEKDAKQAREVTEKEIAASRERDTAIDDVRKDMDNVEGANDPAGSFWDAFGERLRNSERNH